MSDGICREPGCGASCPAGDGKRSKRVYGLCHKHYVRHWRAGTLPEKLPLPPPPSAKACGRCDKTKPITDFPVGPQGGYAARCKKCRSREANDYAVQHRERTRLKKNEWQRANRDKMKVYNKRYQQKPLSKRIKTVYTREWAKNHPEQRRAKHRMSHAIATGKLLRPDHCERCGTECKPHGHHHKGYAPEHWLDVEWLCVPCHYWANREERPASEHNGGTESSTSGSVPLTLF